MILVVVYVGAVAVLFLFVVMMLDVDFAELRQGFLQIPADRRAGRRRAAGRAGAGGRRLGDRPWHCRRPRIASPSRRDHQHRGARACALHALRLLLPGRRPGAAGRDDRRHRADAARTSEACKRQNIAEQVARTPRPPIEVVQGAVRRAGASAAGRWP